MQNKMYQYYTELPSWAKGIVVVGGVAVLGYISFKIYKKLFPSDKEKENRMLLNNVDSEIDRLKRSGQKLTFAEPTYNTLANTLYESMRYAVGDDYGKVVEIMKSMKNDLDVSTIIKAFGIRQNYLFGIPTGEPQDLLTWIARELGEEWAGITSYRVTQINNDWSKKGIKYKI